MRTKLTDKLIDIASLVSIRNGYVIELNTAARYAGSEGWVTDMTVMVVGTPIEATVSVTDDEIKGSSVAKLHDLLTDRFSAAVLKEVQKKHEPTYKDRMDVFNDELDRLKKYIPALEHTTIKTCRGQTKIGIGLIDLGVSFAVDIFDEHPLVLSTRVYQALVKMRNAADDSLNMFVSRMGNIQTEGK
jgi:hypothetical protein